MVTALLESASQAILSVDREGTIVLANQRAEEMFNYTRAELVGAKLEMLLPESKRGSHTREREEYFERPRVRPMGIGMELSARRRDGSEFLVEVSLNSRSNWFTRRRWRRLGGWRAAWPTTSITC